MRIRLFLLFSMLCLTSCCLDVAAATLYQLDFQHTDAGTLPEGWRCVQESDLIHEYPETYDLGARTMEVFGGYQGKALYWREGVAQYGVQEAYPLTLEAGSYVLQFVMAAWKNMPRYSVQMISAETNDIIASLSGQTATPNANGSTSADVSSAEMQLLPFTVTEAGNYIISFSNEDAVEGYDEFLLLDCVVSPSADVDMEQIAFDKRFTHRLQAIETLLQTVGITDEASRVLSEALSAYHGVDKNSSSSALDLVQQQIDSAIAYAEEGLQLAERLKAVYAKYQQYLRSEGSADTNLMALLLSIETAIDGEQYESNEQLASWIEEINAAKTTYNPYEYRYWYDDSMDNAVIELSSQSSLSFLADVSSLCDGFHQLHIQVDGGSGSLSTPRTQSFVKIPQVIGINEMTCLAMADNQIVQQERVHADNGNMLWQVDVSSLPQGFHRLLLQAVTPSGAATNTWQTFFLREATHAELAEMKCVYAVDGAEFNTEAGLLADGTYHFDLDVSALEDGLHRIAYMLNNGKGVTTKAQTQFFTKIPVGGNGITEYWYWLNDQADSNAKKVRLPERKDPFSLITLLSIEHQPLHSSLFEFRVEQGQPVVYAKNDFHIRFYDAAGRFTDATKQFVDEQVSETVTDVTPLQRNQRATAEKPAENAIKWYSLTAAPGDSLSFKIDRAATIQLFSPSGKEVYHVSGSGAVNWGGLHAEETGTYYVALHNVTATSGSTISLDYQHIDRYAVLRQDVTAVGNGGPSTITFQGNGFDELTSVDLMLDETTIASAEIKSEGKATVSVKWDFTDAPLGQYKAVFHYAQGDVTVEKCITVEEAIPVTIAGTESHAAQFLVSQGNTYSYKLKNHGNMTAYDVPMILTVYASDEELLSWVMADGTELADYEVAESAKEGYAYARSYQLTRTLRPGTAESLAIKGKTVTTGHIYVDLDGVGGPSEAVPSIDPNDIYGYQDENGDLTIRDGRTQVYYTIEFENDPEFATASAHEIQVTDVLSPELFDLSTFAPTRIKIGDKEAELNGEKNGVVTIDMRSEINAVAQVEWTFDETTGTAHWRITSLDPQTMEPTDEPMDGVLPVNVNGNGIGQLSFDISLKPDLPDGTEIPNRATIVFDGNEGIDTPTWVNTISNVAIGDVNGDGVVDTQDAIKVIQHYLKKNPADFDERAADVNGDGVVDTQDAIKIIKIYLKKE